MFGRQNKKEEIKTKITEMRMLRWMCDVTDRIELEMNT